MLIIPFSASMSFLVVLSSSCPSTPISAKIVKHVAIVGLAHPVILFTFSVLGISGIFGS